MEHQRLAAKEGEGVKTAEVEVEQVPDSRGADGHIKTVRFIVIEGFWYIQLCPICFLLFSYMFS